MFIPGSLWFVKLSGLVFLLPSPPESPSCRLNDMKILIDNKHGAPNAATPKIFMKYFFVNTKTGEKSGEMLTMVRLDEDAPADGE